MANKKQNSIGYIIKSMMMIPALFRVLANISSLVDYETRLAGKSLGVLFILSLFMLTLLTTTWLCILGILALYLVSLQIGWTLSLFILVMINLILILAISMSILRLKENLLFKHTRQLISSIKN